MQLLIYILFFLVAMLPVAAQMEYLRDLDHYKTSCRNMKPRLKRIRDAFRRVNWERTMTITLAASLSTVAILTIFAQCGTGDCAKGKEASGIYEGLRVAFSVFECDSADFRSYLCCEVFAPKGSFKAVVMWLLAHILPLLVTVSTLGTAVNLLWSYVPHHIPVFSETWYLFSELEPNSIRMARSIHEEIEHTEDTAVFIFLRTQRGKQDPDQMEALKGLNYCLYPKNEREFLRWHWRRRRLLRFFFLSESTDENFNRMKDFLTAVEEKKLFQPNCEIGSNVFQQELYLLSETESAPMLIDHLRKQLTKDQNSQEIFRSTEIHLLDRFRATSYDLLLHEKPLYKHIRDKKLHVLVLGFGRIGREFFRAASSLGVLHDCTTEFTVCDQMICTKLEQFLCGCPELLESVSIYPWRMNADSGDLDQLIESGEYNYIVVALGDDERNIRVASRIKRFYRIRHWEQIEKGEEVTPQPQICVNIEDAVKHGYTEEIWQSEQDWDRSICVFGGLDQAFTKKVLMPENLWKAAEVVHRRLNKLRADDVLNWDEYERRSSIACAAHAVYHVNVVCSQDGEGSYEERLDLISQAEMENMVSTEHRRWMAYVRSEGMRKASIDLMDAYYAESKKGHVDIRSKLTPCLVEAEQLESIWQHLLSKHREKYEGRYAFWHRDELLVLNAQIVRSVFEGDWSQQNTCWKTEWNPQDRRDP